MLDGGPTQIGLESTVLDPNTTPITIYRQGAISASDVERVTGIRATLFQPEAEGAPESLPSPGVGIRHYAPRTPLRLVRSQAELLEFLAEAQQQPTAVLRPVGWPLPHGTTHVLWGNWDSSADLAHNLYAALRDLDGKGSEFLLAPLPDLRPGDDLRAALRDRLVKAALPRRGESPVD